LWEILYIPMPSPVLQHMRDDATAIFQAGLAAVDPAVAIRRYVSMDQDQLRINDKTVDLSHIDRVLVIGAGKASGAMAAALEGILGERITAGLVVVKYDHAVTLSRISLVEAGHPVPDINGQKGAESICEHLQKAGQKDLVICLMSGGGSALLPFPRPGLSLADKQKTIQVLLSCGASIHEINTIRKHLSRIKGGHLAVCAHPARVVSLILSDVVGDDLDVIASGPTVPDPSTYQDCVDILSKYDIADKLPGAIHKHLVSGVEGGIEETPKPGHPVFDKTDHFIIANNFQALDSARQHAESLGYNTLMLTSLLTGETRDAAHFKAAIVRETTRSGYPIQPPACLLSGGETTVTLKGNGKGGRNQEFVLASSLALENLTPVVCLSAGTDGIDGPTDAAGAFMDSTTLTRAKDKGLQAAAYLENNDSYHFFQALGDLYRTGPTRTNVMDIRITLVGEDQGSRVGGGYKGWRVAES
jgi:glycerate 2-kinase